MYRILNHQVQYESDFEDYEEDDDDKNAKQQKNQRELDQVVSNYQRVLDITMETSFGDSFKSAQTL